MTSGQPAGKAHHFFSNQCYPLDVTAGEIRLNTNHRMQTAVRMPAHLCAKHRRRTRSVITTDL